jgi:hypothetical protein
MTTISEGDASNQLPSCTVYNLSDFDAECRGIERRGATPHVAGASKTARPAPRLKPSAAVPVGVQA